VKSQPDVSGKRNKGIYDSGFLVLWFKLPCSFGWGVFATRKAGHADRVTFCLLFEILFRIIRNLIQ